ncbi:MAG: 2-keto-4-pentenoate hydratase [Oligoflexia bacterium]|nr:2-keto-4-pentenoate hydratase [Oligoflexia bacterium]
MDNTKLLKIAQNLIRARESCKAIKPLSETEDEIGIQEAYEISKLVMKERLEGSNNRLLGKKIGLTSRAVQNQLGVKEPDFGYLISDMALVSGAEISLSTLIQPKIEAEVAFVLKKDLEGHNLTIVDVMQATDFVLPALELIDSRIIDWKIKIQDTIADNASSSHFILGTEPRKLTSLSLETSGMVLKLNGEVASTGTGAACLEHPAIAVAWLANTMSKLGEGLKKGEIILSGAFGPVVPLTEDSFVETEISGLGRVKAFFKEK